MLGTGACHLSTTPRQPDGPRPIVAGRRDDLALHRKLLPVLPEWPSIEPIVGEAIEGAFFGG